jgi:hypothetical protein
MLPHAHASVVLQERIVFNLAPENAFRSWNGP